MLRLIGLVVVVLFVVSLAHGERTGTYGDLDRRAETLVDVLTGRLADGVRALGDVLFGPGPGPGSRNGRGLAQEFDDAVRTGDARSRRALANLVLQSCPALGLTCRSASPSFPDPDGALRPERRPDAGGWR